MTSMLSEAKCQINMFTGTSVNCFFSVYPRVLLTMETLSKISGGKKISPVLIEYGFSSVS